MRTMNKVFEHAGDLVNVKVAHNLMKLIAEDLERMMILQITPQIVSSINLDHHQLMGKSWTHRVREDEFSQAYSNDESVKVSLKLSLEE
ncbi:hypothetical protein Prudu_005643 [Prunus dulcis]|uniref:Uncharacterized protein n=1 Tax=Prunus dulcis TaxID=3755 RepID=A0A4Y1QY86_PRUDU|nr:hypothetical protein Prudu_005643 [Prunus dulcis]